MLVSATKLLGTPILSLEIGGAIGQIADVIIDPDTLKAIAFRLNGGIVAVQTILMFPAFANTQLTAWS